MERIKAKDLGKEKEIKLRNFVRTRYRQRYKGVKAFEEKKKKQRNKRKGVEQSGSMHRLWLLPS